MILTLIGFYFKVRCKSTLNKGNDNNKNNDNKMYKLIYKQIHKRLTYKRGFSFLVIKKFTNLCFQPTFRSNCPQVFCKKDVLRNFTKFTGKHLCHRWHRCFPVNFVKFLRTPFLLNTSGGCF